MSLDKKTVLAIDDFALNLLIIKEALAKDVNIYIAKSGPLALKMLDLIDVDLFLLDIQMPEMDGFEFLALLRKLEKYKETPVVFVTAKDKETIVKEALSYEPVDYILKPFQQTVLREKILGILELKAPIEMKVSLQEDKKDDI